MIDHVHELAVRTVDYNPNRPNVLATGGDDGFLRIWDTRQPKEALVSVRHHKHWCAAALEIAGAALRSCSVRRRTPCGAAGTRSSGSGKWRSTASTTS